MKYLKLISKNIGIMALFLLIGTFLITILNYFNMISGSLLSIFKIIIMVLSMFIGGFLIGKQSDSKGWLEGLKLGGIVLLLITIINFLFIKNFAIKSLIYYLILVVCSIFGSMIGISKKASSS